MPVIRHDNHGDRQIRQYIRRKVLLGARKQTNGGLKREDLMLRRGHVVAKRARLAAKARMLPGCKFCRWHTSFMLARRILGVKGFVPCGGSSELGRRLLGFTRYLYNVQPPTRESLQPRLYDPLWSGPDECD